MLWEWLYKDFAALELFQGRQYLDPHLMSTGKGSLRKRQLQKRLTQAPPTDNTLKKILHDNSGEINFPACLFICFIQFLKCRIWSTWCYILDKVRSQLHMWQDKINMVGRVISFACFLVKVERLKQPWPHTLDCTS